MPERTVTIECTLPPVECSPNSRFHWRSVRAAAKSYRMDCREAFRGVGALPAPVTVHLEFYLGRPKTTLERYQRAGRYFPKDVDNAVASVKALIDALKDAGVVASDSKGHVRLGGVALYTRAKEHGGRACVVVTLEPASALERVIRPRAGLKASTVDAIEEVLGAGARRIKGGE